MSETQDIVLMPHQERAIEKINNSDGVLVYHGTGSGKTITSLMSIGDNSADIVVPASLRQNYAKEMAKLFGSVTANIRSYDNFRSHGSKDSDMLILDEPQRIGNAESGVSKKIVNSAQRYKKRVLLTATPAMNHPYELAPIIRTINPGSAAYIPLDKSLFDSRFVDHIKVKPGFINSVRGARAGDIEEPKGLDTLRKAVKGRVDYYKGNNEGYPSRVDVQKDIEMSREQEHYYDYVTKKADPIIALKIRANLPLSKAEKRVVNSFFAASRQVSNTAAPYGSDEVLSPKLKAVVDDFEDRMKKSDNHKGIIYSNYIESGIDPISEELEARGIPFGRFTGELTSDKRRKEVIDKYNRGDIKALLLSSAGSEGIDLKGTRTIQIVEPHWNKNKIEQVIGRGIRYKSHDHLPKDERSVDVIKYRSVRPKKFFNKNQNNTSDVYLENLSESKQKLLDKFLDVLREEGSV